MIPLFLGIWAREHRSSFVKLLLFNVFLGTWTWDLRGSPVSVLHLKVPSSLEILSLIPPQVQIYFPARWKSPQVQIYCLVRWKSSQVKIYFPARWNSTIVSPDISSRHQRILPLFGRSLPAQNILSALHFRRPTLHTRVLVVGGPSEIFFRK